MDHDQLEQFKKEYYEVLEANPTLHQLLNTHGGLILARVGSHPPWPARFSEPGEFAKMSRHRTKKGLLCVYFFGTRNYGWVKPSAIMPFSNDLTSLKPTRKYSPAMVQRAIAAMAEAKVVLDDTDEYQMCFYDRIMDRKDEPVDLPCELCNRVEDHFSLLILCDGKGCGREFHMGCFRPPMEKVPIGDWYCPECEKDPAKQVKGTEEGAPESRDGLSSRVSRPTGEAVSLEQLSSGDMAKKVKKEKIKAGEPGSLKRKLPGSTREKGKRVDADDSPGKGAKKARSQRSLHVDGLTQLSPEQASSRPSTPTSSGSRRGASGDVHGVMHHGRDGAAVESEERCLLCGYGGELVVCEFSGCTKVYHQFCLGAYPFPKDEDATWFCPRHTCALSGIREVVEESDGASLPKPARKSSMKKQLWKCATCPVALSDDAMPTIPKAMIVSKPNRTFQCAFCSSSAPLKVQLAKQLERIWSMMATNRQGMPFCGPIFPGLPRPSDRTEPLNLFTILAKIRRLEYNDSASFASDVRDVVEYALEVVRDSPQPLSEAARTMTIVCEEQLMIHRTKLDTLEEKIAELKSSVKAKKLLEVGLITGFPGEKRRWPLRWRQECGAWEEKGYPSVESRSLSEWVAYITTAPLYASCDELDDMGARATSPVASSESERRPTDTQEGVPSEETSGIDEPDVSQQFPAFPGLTLSEGADVMIALTELSRHNGDSTRNFGGWQEREIDDVDGRDFFLSPSATEMQQMFEQQSVLLRRALEGHAALQKAWLVSKQRLLGLGGDVGLSVGEGRIAAELRVANKNLRARLRNKDKLVDQLSNEHFKLRAEVRSLQAELAHLKGEAPAAEEASATKADNASAVAVAEETGTDMDTGSPTRKSSRPAAKARSEKKTKAAAKPGRKIVERKSA